MSTTRSPALPAARPVHATFHLRMPVCPRSVRLVPLADQPLDCDSPADSALRTTVAVPEPGKQGPATTTGIPPGPAASLVGTTAPAASATPLSTATSGPAGTTASPPPSPATPPSSREIILPGRRPSAEEERQRQLEREQIQQVVAALRMAAAEIRRQHQERLQEWQRAAITLAMTIASRLLYERIQSGEFPIEARVREMIAQLANEPVVAVRLHPQDLKLLQERLAGQPLLSESEHPRFIADATLARGECRVEGRDTILLSDVVRQLQEIQDELLRSLGHARS